MKPCQTLRNSIVNCVIVLALVSGAAAQSPSGAAKVIRMKGSARYSTGNFVFQPIKVGDVLYPGAAIQTSTDQESYVDLVLGGDNAAVPEPVTYRPYVADSMASADVQFHPTSEQNVVRVWGDSALIVVKLTGMETGADTVSETVLDLKQGRISGTVKKLSAASRYEVKLPNGVAGIRGTIFDIQAAGVVKVYVGSMVVSWVDPTTQQVTTQTVVGGQSYDVISKQISLLPPESMSDLADLSANLQVVGQILPTVTTLATDRTVIGMSPVGANSSTLPVVQPSP